MIRYLTPQDHAIYRVIRLEALSTDPDAFGETLAIAQARSEADQIEWLSKVIIPGRKNIVLIEVEKRPVAMCGFGLSDDDNTSGFIWGMFVSSAQRRKNHGQTMLEEAERWLQAKGISRVTAHVAAPNEGAINFYRRCGYAIGPASGFLRPGSSIPVHPIERKISA